MVFFNKIQDTIRQRSVQDAAKDPEKKKEDNLAADVEQVLDKNSLSTIKNWYSDRYESAIIQRNFLLILTISCIMLIFVAIILVQQLKDENIIQPFVIEIEEKSGIPTVVEPLSTRAYTASEAMRKYFLVKYLRARQEYNFNSYRYNFNTVVRVLSSGNVYYKDYAPKYSVNNQNSPYNLYGGTSKVSISIKSFTFPTAHSVYIRFTQKIRGAINNSFNKIAYIEFGFKNLKMNGDERLVNPLGFQITLYRVDDDKG